MTFKKYKCKLCLLLLETSFLFKMSLSQYVNINTGYPFRGAIPEQVGSGVRVIQMRDISKINGLIATNAVECLIEPKREPDWLQVNDIVICGRGYNNDAAIVTAEHVANTKLLAAPHFYVLRVTSPQLLAPFLAWQLNLQACQQYFKTEAEGTFLPSIRKAVLADTPIVVPPIAMQQRIIGLTHNLHNQRKTIEQLLSNNEQLQNGLLQQLISH